MLSRLLYGEPPCNPRVLHGSRGNYAFGGSQPPFQPSEDGHLIAISGRYTWAGPVEPVLSKGGSCSEEALPRIGSAGELEAPVAELVSTGMPANDSKGAERGTEPSAALCRSCKLNSINGQTLLVIRVAKSTRSQGRSNAPVLLLRCNSKEGFISSQARAPAGADVHLVN